MSDHDKAEIVGSLAAVFGLVAILAALAFAGVGPLLIFGGVP
jgi:hypothetical protein